MQYCICKPLCLSEWYLNDSNRLYASERYMFPITAYKHSGSIILDPLHRHTCFFYMESLNELWSKEPPAPTPCRDWQDVSGRICWAHKFVTMKCVVRWGILGGSLFVAPVSVRSLSVGYSPTACLSPVAAWLSPLFTTKHLHVLAFKAIRP